MSITIREYTHYNESEILPLYESAGWIAYTRDPELLRRAYENSLTALASYEDGKLIGVLRAVGDGLTIVFVQDLLVLPAHRRKGAGSALLRAVRDKFSSVRQLQLTCDDSPELATFYESQGLRPLSALGMRGYMA